MSPERETAFTNAMRHTLKVRNTFVLVICLQLTDPSLITLQPVVFIIPAGPYSPRMLITQAGDC
jgi:hypothetical protein